MENNCKIKNSNKIFWIIFFIYVVLWSIYNVLLTIWRDENDLGFMVIAIVFFYSSFFVSFVIGILSYIFIQKRFYYIPILWIISVLPSLFICYTIFISNPMYMLPIEFWRLILSYDLIFMPSVIFGVLLAKIIHSVVKVIKK